MAKIKFSFQLKGHSFKVYPNMYSSYYGEENSFSIEGPRLFFNKNFPHMSITSEEVFYLNEIFNSLQAARNGLFFNRLEKSNASCAWWVLMERIELWQEAERVAWEKIKRFRCLE